MQRHFKSVGCIFLLLLVFVAYSSATELHQAKFAWEIRGGVVNPEQWIYDGDIPLALFENRTIEQPGQQLMFFNRVPKPIVLRHLRLTPHGAPLIECAQLYCKIGTVVTDQLIDLVVEGAGTDRLIVTWVTQDRWKVATSRRVLTLTYDASHDTYIYDFQGTLEFLSPELFNCSPQAFEFTDPWFVGCPGPALEFSGMWKRRYQTFIYESADGSVLTMPINHFTTSTKANIKLKPDGIFMTSYEPDGNPAIQFVGDTALTSSIAICWWGYDFHLSRAVNPDELFAPVTFRYRFFQCPDKTACELASKAVPREMDPQTWKGMDEYPIYERHSSFDKGLRLDQPFKGSFDPFPWIRNGDGALWDTTFGRTDTYSMKIVRSEKGLTRWQTFQGDGEGYFVEPWTPCKGYQVSCYVKTDSIVGRGSTIAVQYHIPNSPQRFPVVTAKRLTGTSGWTKLDIVVGPPVTDGPEVGCLMIMLQQDGSGTTWFDDLDVTVIR